MRPNRCLHELARRYMASMLVLAMTASCLFESWLNRESDVFAGFEAAFQQTRWILLICLAVWFSAFLLLTFRLNDLPLVGLVLVAVSACLVQHPSSGPAKEAMTILATVTLGRGAKTLLNRERRGQTRRTDEWALDQSQLSPAAIVFLGLVVLLAFSSWWNSGMPRKYYNGPRWVGLWDNPNEYGVLMSAGVVLAAGMLLVFAAGCGWHGFLSRSLLPRTATPAQEDSVQGRRRFTRGAILLLGGFMMWVGLLLSFSRGAWVGAAVGLLYLAKVYGKFKWRFVLPAIVIVTAVVWLCWNATPDAAPWYVKRMDLGRPSAQHRLAAWRAGLEIIRDHPFGVGWNKAAQAYEESYSPPENSAAAIGTNDYLVLGTELGIPGLICFVAYVALCFRKVGRTSPVTSDRGGAGTRNHPQALPTWTRETSTLVYASRAAALAMLVGFWFDGGLFRLATAALFWVLLELGKAEGFQGVARRLDSSLEASAVARTNAFEGRFRQTAGFTLAELLVVISVIGTITALLLPALAHAKGRAQNATCANHFRQLTMAWRMYADDNQGQLVPVFYFRAGQVNSNAWVLGSMNDDIRVYPPVELGVLDSTNENGIKRGSLFHYTGSVGVYHCPADKSQVGGVPRLRSYSLNGWMGGTYVKGQSNYWVFKREGDIVNPPPSKAWVFIDEHERSINDGWFAVDMTGERGLLDAPATRHNNAYALSFADGHVEIWKLVDARSISWTTLPIPNRPANPDWSRLAGASSSLR